MASRDADPAQGRPPEEQLYAPIEWERRRPNTRTSSTSAPRGSRRSRSTGRRSATPSARRPLAELRDAFGRARDDTEVGAIIFTGAGDEAFCSGGDQRIRGDDGYIGDDEVAQQGVGRLDVGDLHVQIRRLPKPVVAMVAGYAVGGGHILHLVCDLTIAAENARFGQTGPAGRQLRRRLRRRPARPRTSASSKAKEIWFLCRLYDADEALEMGLVNTVVPLAELERETVAWCREMPALSPLVAAPAEVELQRRRGRAHRPPAALPRRDAALLHDRGGPGGPQRLPGEAPPDFSKFPQPAVSPRMAWPRGRDVPLRIWLMAARPRTLPAAIAPVLVGTAAVGRAASASRTFALGRVRRRALIGSIFIQIGTNLANDYSDAKRGADTADRLGPVRVTSAGLIAPRRVLVATWLAFARRRRSPASTWPPSPGWVILAVGVASIAAGVLYTGGPRPYGYAGLGELFVFLFFGLVAVNGSYYVQLEELDALPLAAVDPGRPARRRRSSSSTTSATSTPTAAPASARSRSALGPRAHPAASTTACLSCGVRRSWSRRPAAATARGCALIGAARAPLAIPPLRAVLERAPTGPR